MDAATDKQKAYIRDLFLQCGVPDWIFKPVKHWKIKKKEASSLITGLNALQRQYSGDLKDSICCDLCGKNMLKVETRTVDQIEEDGNKFPSDWRGQLEFYGINPPDGDGFLDFEKYLEAIP